MKTKIFKIAHEIRRSTKCTMSEALKKSWQVSKLEISLKNGIVWFTFRKKDGSIRLAKGTLKNIGDIIKGTGKFTYKSIPYFDFESNGIRSFKPENFMKIYN